jgi:hypothetical protein
MTLCQIDSIVPNYPCPAADAIRNEYQSVPEWTDHLEANQDLQNRLNSILGTSGLRSWSSWCQCAIRYFVEERTQASLQMTTSSTLSPRGLVMVTLYRASRPAHVSLKRMQT